MTTSNHILAGGLIAITLHNPILVLPIAFASHFVLDALPHYGFNGDGYGEALKHKTTFIMEALGLVGLALLFISGVYGLNIALVAAIIAVSPDFEWPYRYFLFERRGLTPPDSFLTKFHQKIQWCERSWGIVPEVAFFAIGYWVLIGIK